MTSDILDEIKKEILAKLPKDTQVSKVEFEGPEVVVYTKNPQVITENGDLVRSLAKELRKRIIIRSDKSALLEQEDTRISVTFSSSYYSSNGYFNSFVSFKVISESVF